MLIIFTQSVTIASDIDVFFEGKQLGLKTSSGEVLVKPEYRKLIRVGDHSWIAQKNTRYGLIDNNGTILVPIKYRHVQRFFGKFARLGNDNDYGLYDETGKVIVPPMYSSIEILYGKMFLTCYKHKYGIVDFDGNILLPNIFEDLYMPDKESIRVQHKGEWTEIKKADTSNIELPQNSKNLILNNEEIKLTRLVADTSLRSTYYTITAADYGLKIISSLSPSYEQTIDDLMLSHGAETITIFMNPVWIIKFPFVYGKKYVTNLFTPNNGPLSDIRQTIRRKIIE